MSAVMSAGRVASALSVQSRQEGRRRNRLSNGSAAQRDRLVQAMGDLVAELGRSTSVHHVCQRAGISRRTFYDLYRDYEECYLDATRRAYDRLLADVDTAVLATDGDWESSAVAVVGTLLSSFQADRGLATLCVTAPIAGGHGALALRREAIAHIAGLLSDAPRPGDLAQEVVLGTVGAVWELVHRELTDNRDRSLLELGEQALYLTLAPFIGRRDALARARRPLPAAPAAMPFRGPGVVVTELARMTLTHLAINPGAGNRDLSLALQVREQSQMSRHLHRLRREGLVRCRRHGRSNAWELTRHGHDTLGALAPGLDPRKA